MKPHACLYPGHLTLLRTAFPHQFYVTFKWLFKAGGFTSWRWSRRSFIRFGEETQKKSPGPSATMLISLQLLQGLSTRKKRHLIAAAKRCKGGVSHFNDQIMAGKEMAATPPKRSHNCKLAGRQICRPDNVLSVYPWRQLSSSFSWQFSFLLLNECRQVLNKSWFFNFSKHCVGSTRSSRA